MGSFRPLMVVAGGLLVLTLLAAFVMPPPWSWGIGLLYIGYDTWLLTDMVRASCRALRLETQGGVRRVSRTVAVVVAARNERTVLPECIDAVLGQDSPPERLLVIDDGSTDGTAEMLAARYPTVQVLRKPNSGKARSLNEALQLLAEDVVVTLDADTNLEPGALAAIRSAFEQDPELAAACGVLRPICTPGWQGRMFELYQRFEYLRGFLWRLAWAEQESLVLVSGAFAAFRRDRLTEITGFDPHSLVEDYELMFRLHRRAAERGEPLPVRVIGEARATTDSPATLRLFLRQRTRWFAGFIETMFRHQDMVGANRYGRLGRFHLRVKTADTLLPVYGLLAVVTFVGLLVTHRAVGLVIPTVIVLKLLLDLSCHFYSMLLYQRWLKEPVTVAFCARALLATLTEPLFFQLARQFGALLGWVAFLRGRIEWYPQREMKSGAGLSASAPL